MKIFWVLMFCLDETGACQMEECGSWVQVATPTLVEIERLQ